MASRQGAVDFGLAPRRIVAMLMAAVALLSQGCTLTADHLVLATDDKRPDQSPAAWCPANFQVDVDVTPILPGIAESIRERTVDSTLADFRARGCPANVVVADEQAAFRVSVRRFTVPLTPPYWAISVLTLGLVPTWDTVKIGEFEFEDVEAGRREVIGLDATRVAHVLFIPLELSLVDDEVDHQASYRKALDRFLAGRVRPWEPIRHGHPASVDAPSVGA